MTMHKTSRIYIHFWEWEILCTTAVSFVDDYFATPAFKTSLMCQTHTTTHRRVTMLVEFSGTLQMKWFPEMEWTKDSNQRTNAFNTVVSLEWYPTAFWTCAYITYLPFGDRTLYQSNLCFLNDCFRDVVSMYSNFDLHVCLWYFANS
jgi:hypothetical protein